VVLVEPASAPVLAESEVDFVDDPDHRFVQGDHSECGRALRNYRVSLMGCTPAQ
jgi:hypothetical protein